MFESTVGELLARIEGVLLQGSAEARVRGVFTDTRAPLPGGLFVALEGPRFDGNRFTLEAARQGAAACLFWRADALAPELRVPAIWVPNTRRALAALAASHRTALGALRWCAVTGSAGKSSVKDMLAHILAARWPVHKAAKSFNNEIGVPLTVLGAGASHRAVVLELGTNHPGEIEPLARLARPHVAVITNAGPVHLEALGSVQGVAEEKGHILDFQTPGDTAVLNADDGHVELWRARARGVVLTFGTGPQADVRATQIQVAATGTRFLLGIGGEDAEVRLRLPGRHNVRNALAAAAAAHACGFSLPAIAAGLETFGGTERRMQAFQVGGATVIDDAYNANPLSFQAALEALDSYPGRRRFLVAGDMLELGSACEDFHRDLGRALVAAKVDGLLTVGPLAALAGHTAVQLGLPAAAWQRCACPEDAAARLRKLLLPGDVALIKGSNGVHLERCLEALTRRTFAAAD